MHLEKVPLISVIILNYNGAGFTEACVGSVLKSDYPQLEVILVDNASTDNSLHLIMDNFGKDSRLRILRNNSNLYFAGGNNSGIRQAKGELIVILNNDTEVDPAWLKELEIVFKDNNIGAIQPKVRIFGSNPPLIDTAGGQLDRLGYASGWGFKQLDNEEFNIERDVFYAAGTAMALRKEVLDQVGLFDEKFKMHWEDVDLSWRIHLKGYRIVSCGKSIVYHKGSLSMNKFSGKAEVAWHIRKNRIAGMIKNLSLNNLIMLLPILLLIYAIISLKELLINRDFKLAFSSLRAIVWNLDKLNYLTKSHRYIQHRIRKVSDKQIFSLMERNLVISRMLRGNKV